MEGVERAFSRSVTRRSFGKTVGHAARAESAALALPRHFPDAGSPLGASLFAAALFDAGRAPFALELAAPTRRRGGHLKWGVPVNGLPESPVGGPAGHNVVGAGKGLWNPHRLGEVGPRCSPQQQARGVSEKELPLREPADLHRPGDEPLAFYPQGGARRPGRRLRGDGGRGCTGPGDSRRHKKGRRDEECDEQPARPHRPDASRLFRPSPPDGACQCGLEPLRALLSAFAGPTRPIPSHTSAQPPRARLKTFETLASSRSRWRSA
jgi:hypothetical protein